MPSVTFGPVGMSWRAEIRRMAAASGVTLDEHRRFFESRFTASGDAAALDALRRQVLALERHNDACDRKKAVEEAVQAASYRWWKPTTWTEVSQGFGALILLLVVLSMGAAIVGEVFGWH
jgi:hypothetical protein